MHDPDYLGREAYCTADVMLEACHALKFVLSTEPWMEAVVWRDKPSLLRPLEEGKRISQLAPGDEVELRGERYVVAGVELFR